MGGTLDNRARITAGRDLGVKAGTLNNQATGELVAGRNNTINVTGTLTNAGLIDGVNTRITAGAVTNLGRIYGDNLAIGTGSLVNDVGAGGAAVIAARSAMDLGATYLVNREHALIYSAGDLRIGGALDAAGRAVGQAVSLQNASATIEAAGNATISAATLLNQNTRYASETVVVVQAQGVLHARRHHGHVRRRDQLALRRSHAHVQQGSRLAGRRPRAQAAAALDQIPG